MATKWLLLLVAMVTITMVFCLYVTQHIFYVKSVEPEARANRAPAYYSRHQERKDGLRGNQTTTTTTSRTTINVTTRNVLSDSLSDKAKQLLCSLQSAARFRTLPADESPWKELGYQDIEARLGLLQLYQGGFHTCAAVMNSAAILGSGSGKDIDSHDAVLRFNSAPTKNYMTDVGTKTTLRLMNSQVAVKPAFHWTTDPLYRNVTMVLWDPKSYGGTIEEWYKKPDFDLFSAYKKRRLTSPWEHLYILDPRYLWELWEVLRKNSVGNIVRNVPSSGFTGIHLLLTLCDNVDVYEYIPSIRQTSRCHYYETYINSACTHGAYHPLKAEKELIQKLNIGPEEDIRKKGKVILPGFRHAQCKT